MPKLMPVSPKIRRLIGSLEDCNPVSKVVKAALQCWETKCLEAVTELEMCISSLEIRAVGAAAPTHWGVSTICRLAYRYQPPIPPRSKDGNTGYN